MKTRQISVEKGSKAAPKGLVYVGIEGFVSNTLDSNRNIDGARVRINTKSFYSNTITRVKSFQLRRKQSQNTLLAIRCCFHIHVQQADLKIKI
jgi:hypothetical protein